MGSIKTGKKGMRGGVESSSISYGGKLSNTVSDNTGSAGSVSIRGGGSAHSPGGKTKSSIGKK